MPARFIAPRRADPPENFRRLQRLGAAVMNPLAVQAIANAIQTQEGYYPGSVSYTDNNPGNLVYAGQPGATAGPGGFAVFSSYNAGYQALVNQINLDATRGTDVNGNPVETVGDLIESWAPASAGNDTAAYIASVSAQTGFDADSSLLSLDASTVPAGSGLIDVTGLMDDSSDTSGIGVLPIAGAALAAVLIWKLFF